MIFFIFIGLSVLIALAFGLYPMKKSPRLSLLVLLLVLLLPGFGYYHWGAYEAWQNFSETAANQALVKQLMKSPKGPERLIQKLKEQIAKDPSQAKGWYLLGRLYASKRDWKAAEQAFARARALEPEDEAIAVNYGQSLWQNNQQHFNGTIRRIFHALLKKNPRQPDALAMLAMDCFAEKNYPMAISYWEQLLKLAPPQSEEAMALRQAIAKAIEDMAHQPQD